MSALFARAFSLWRHLQMGSNGHRPVKPRLDLPGLLRGHRRVAFVLSSGPAVPALLASCAIPGVFPPMTIGRRELIDGGVANHTPIATAVELGARVIYVLPIGYPWLHEEPANALGMALQALAR